LGGINSRNCTIMVDGKPVRLKAGRPRLSLDFSNPNAWAEERKKVQELKQKRHKRDLEIQDCSDGMFLRECGTIPGAPKRKPSKAAIKFSKLKAVPALED
jgi:hypothetical protein